MLRGRRGVETVLMTTARSHRLAHLTPHVMFELYRGVVSRPEMAQESRRIQHLGKFFFLLPFGREAAQLAARMEHDLRVEGCPIPLLDVLIAASALAGGDGEIITRDTRHFDRLKKFGLAVTRPEDAARPG